MVGFYAPPTINIPAQLLPNAISDAVSHRQVMSSFWSLKCTDCEDDRHFPSAASLLSHFAQHILDDDAGTSEAASLSDSAGVRGPKKKKNSSILEKVLLRTSAKYGLSQKSVLKSGSDPPSLLPIHLASLYSKADITLQTVMRKKLEPPSECSLTPLPASEKDQERNTCRSSSCSSTSSNSSSSSSFNGHVSHQKYMNGSSINLAKFDMQERLENCVLNLVCKRESKKCTQKVMNDHPASITDRKYFPEPNDNWDTTSASDEINPLTLCTVTIDDCDPPLDGEESKMNNNSGRSTGRKQLLPKKIPRPVNGMLSELSSKLPQHTTITTVTSPSLDREKPHTKKKYPCHICTKVFGWSTDLKRHILIHTGERPFKCKLCPSSFTRNFLLQKHENKVHHRQNGKKSINCQMNSISLRLQSDQPVGQSLIVSPVVKTECRDEVKGEEVANVSGEEQEGEGDDRSSADENDNHSRKRKNVSLEIQEQCYSKQPWHSPSLTSQHPVQQLQS